MKTENGVLMDMAERSLKGKWGLAIGTYLVYVLIMLPFQIVNHYYPMESIFLIIFVGPMAFGMSVFYLSLSRNQDARIEQIFKGFDRFGTALGAYLLMAVFILLWALLLIIPGIIAGISYSMTIYILIDDESIGVMDAIEKSKKMMDGYKWKYFCLCMRYLLLALLCILTLGIGFLWLIPYMNVGFAKFYDDIKGNLIPIENIHTLTE